MQTDLDSHSSQYMKKGLFPEKSASEKFISSSECTLREVTVFVSEFPYDIRVMFTCFGSRANVHS